MLITLLQVILIAAGANVKLIVLIILLAKVIDEINRECYHTNDTDCIVNRSCELFTEVHHAAQATAVFHGSG